jgi:hypothetical protein
MKLFWYGVAFIVTGVFLCAVGSTIPYVDPPSWDVILRNAVGALFTAVTKALSGPDISDRLQGLGSAFGYIGFVLIVLWIIQMLLPKKLEPDSPQPPAPNDTP